MSQYPRIRAASSDLVAEVIANLAGFVSIPSHSGSLFGLSGWSPERLKQLGLNTLAFGQPLRTSWHDPIHCLRTRSQYPRIRAASSDTTTAGSATSAVTSQYPRIRAASSDPLGVLRGSIKTHVSIPSHSGSLFGPMQYGWYDGEVMSQYPRIRAASSDL